MRPTTGSSPKPACAPWSIAADGTSAIGSSSTTKTPSCGTPSAMSASSACCARAAFDPPPVTQLVDGWHILENGAWRWTKRRFSIIVAPGAQRLNLKFTVPPNLELPLTLTASAAGAALATHTLTQPGDFECAQQISRLAPKSSWSSKSIEPSLRMPPTPASAPSSSEPSNWGCQRHAACRSS